MSQPIAPPLFDVPHVKPLVAIVVALGYAALFVVMVLLVGCAPVTRASAPLAVATPIVAAAPAPRATQGLAPEAAATSLTRNRQAISAVLVAGRHVFAIDGPASAPAAGEALGSGPATLRITEGARLAPTKVTLVGYDGTCVATTARRATLWSPNAAFAVRELDGCADLAARATGLLVAVDGAHQARWLVPIAGEVRALPPDHELGERAVHLQSYSFADSPARLVERVTERAGAPCDEALHDLIVLDVLGQPEQSHADFDLAGAVELEHTTLAVLVGWFDPQALRVVDLDAAGHVALDARLAVFADVAKNEC